MQLPARPADGGRRYPGFHTMAQAGRWDPVTRAAVESRLGPLPGIRFFTPQEEACARALVDQLLDQRDEPRVRVVELIDARLAEDQTDGWHYDNLPPDREAWSRSLAALDDEAREEHGDDFAGCAREDQAAILNSIHALGRGSWRGFPADRLWSLWTRYACTAFYSHPWAWDEIGFGGPAYPRGYKNLGIDRLEPFEVPDANPFDNPVRPRGDAVDKGTS
ncbi:gluconate 2-dehydrogenase subunit 3 family protein [Parafrigoribacterium mesophilum]